MQRAAGLPEMDAAPALRALVLHVLALHASACVSKSLKARDHLDSLLDVCENVASCSPIVAGFE